MDYVAFPLDGCGTPPMPGDNPVYSVMLAVSKTSGKAAQIAKFVQWALMGRDNYDLVRYGVEGVDYRLEGEKIAYLDKGKDIPMNELYSSYMFLSLL